MRKGGLELTKLRSSAPEKQLLQPVEHATPAFDRGNGFERLVPEQVAGVAAREEIGGGPRGRRGGAFAGPGPGGAPPPPGSRPARAPTAPLGGGRPARPCSPPR